MPTYEYVCTGCHHEWETEQSIKDEPLTICPQCSAETAKRLISRSGGFVLKGEGWTPASHYGHALNDGPRIANATPPPADGPKLTGPGN